MLFFLYIALWGLCKIIMGLCQLRYSFANCKGIFKLKYCFIVVFCLEKRREGGILNLVAWGRVKLCTRKIGSSGSFVPAVSVVHPRTGVRLHRTMNQGLGYGQK